MELENRKTQILKVYYLNNKQFTLDDNGRLSLPYSTKTKYSEKEEENDDNV